MQDFRGGGAERMFVNLALGMRYLGCEVEIAALSEVGPYRAQLEGKVPVCKLNASRALTAPFSLASYLRSAKPDAILSGLVHLNVAAVAAHQIIGRKGRLVLSERNTISVDGAQHGALTVKLAHKLAPLAYRRADRIIAVSEGVADDLAQWANLDRSQIVAVNNPVVTPQLLENARQSPAHPWFEDDGPPIIVAAGRLHPQKDFGVLIDAIAKVRETRACRLLILGEGELLASLQARSEALGLSEVVQFPGFQNNPHAFFARAAVFVLSSRWEGSPNALVEAMACGAPVVATDCPSGPAEILMDGKFGPLVPMGDVVSLARAIERVLSAPTPKAELTRRAGDFSQETAAANYLNVLLDRPG